MKNGHYNRRLAAISFLSNISIDGTARSLKKIPSNIKPCETYVFKPIDQEPPKYVSTSPNIKVNPESLLMNFPAESNSLLYTKLLDNDITGAFRERTSTVGSEYSIEKYFYSNLQKKRLFDDKSHGIFSSSESVVSTTGSRKELQLIPHLPKGKKLSSHRVIVVSQTRKIPATIFSIITYNKFKGDLKNISGVRRRNTSGPRPLSAINDYVDAWSLIGIERERQREENSYSQYLAPSKYIKILEHADGNNKHTTVARCYSHDSGTYRAYPSSPPVSSEKGGESSEYDPNLLDDPELIAGKHRTLLPFKSYITSVIHYARATDLKKELNDKFKERFPAIELTLSKLRSLKREMRKIATPDLLTTAYAYVYFERLVHLKLISKQNRKLCAGASLLLAAKLNDIKGDQLKQFIEKTEGILRINRRELIQSEFVVLVALEFGLQVPTSHVLPHYHRLLSET